MSMSPKRTPIVTGDNQVPMIPRPPSIPQPQSGDGNSKGKWLGLLLVLVAFGLIYSIWQDENLMARLDGNRQVASTDVSDEKVRRRLEGQVNRHVQLTNRRMEIEKEQIRVESFMVPKVGEFVLDRAGPTQSFSHRGDQSEMNAVRDLRRNEQQISTSANDIIQSEIAHQQVDVEVDLAYREEYVRQFKENARRNGYDVQLTSDGRVIGVRQIRQGASQQGSGDAYR